MRRLLLALAVLLFIIPAGLAQVDITLNVPPDVDTDFEGFTEDPGLIVDSASSQPLSLAPIVFSDKRVRVALEQAAIDSCPAGKAQVFIQVYKNAQLKDSRKSTLGSYGEIRKGDPIRYGVALGPFTGPTDVGDFGVVGWVRCGDKAITTPEMEPFFIASTGCTPTPELCSDGKDQDCDGLFDDSPSNKACRVAGECAPQEKFVCYGKNVYAADSCGNKGTKPSSQCQLGCAQGRCLVSLPPAPIPAVIPGPDEEPSEGEVGTTETTPSRPIGSQIVFDDVQFRDRCVEPGKPIPVSVILRQNGLLSGGRTEPKTLFEIVPSSKRGPSTKIEVGIYSDEFARKNFPGYFGTAVEQSVIRASAVTAPNCIPSEGSQGFIQTQSVNLPLPDNRQPAEFGPLAPTGKEKFGSIAGLPFVSGESPWAGKLNYDKDGKYWVVVGLYQKCFYEGGTGYGVETGEIKPQFYVRLGRINVSTACPTENATELPCGIHATCVASLGSNLAYCDQDTHTCKKYGGDGSDDPSDPDKTSCRAFTKAELKKMDAAGQFQVGLDTCITGVCPSGSKSVTLQQLELDGIISKSLLGKAIDFVGGLEPTGLSPIKVGTRLLRENIPVCVKQGGFLEDISIQTLILIGAGILFLFIIIKLVGK